MLVGRKLVVKFGELKVVDGPLSRSLVFCDFTATFYPF